MTNNKQAKKNAHERARITGESYVEALRKTTDTTDYMPVAPHSVVHTEDGGVDVIFEEIALFSCSIDPGYTGTVYPKWAAPTLALRGDDVPRHDDPKRNPDIAGPWPNTDKAKSIMDAYISTLGFYPVIFHVSGWIVTGRNVIDVTITPPGQITFTFDENPGNRARWVDEIIQTRFTTKRGLSAIFMDRPFTPLTVKDIDTARVKSFLEAKARRNG